MKKIIFLIIATMFALGLSAQEKITVDEKSSQEMKRIVDALESTGLEYEIGAIPESKGFKPANSVSVDEVIENLKSMNSKSSNAYIDYVRAFKAYKFVEVAPGVYEAIWEGDMSVSPQIEGGDDWSIVRHTKEDSSGNIYETHIVYYPNSGYMYDSPSEEYCCELAHRYWTYVSGIGWVYLDIWSGNKVCTG